MNCLIPPQLQRREFRFIPIKPGTKAPEGSGWQKNNNFSYYDSRLQNKILARSAYGVVCGHGNLLVIDFDSEQLQQQLIPQLPPTFTVKSGGRGLYHMYYIVDKPTNSFKIIERSDDKIITLADIQCKGKQVIGPNSKHADTGNIYRAINTEPIARLNIRLFESVFSKYSRLDSSDRESVSKTTGLRICPFHKDSSASVAIYENNTFYCFGCHAYGLVDALDNPDNIRRIPSKNGTLVIRSLYERIKYKYVLMKENGYYI